MATYSSVLAWRIPGTAGPGGLLSMGSHRFGHDWSDLAAAAAERRIIDVFELWCWRRLLRVPWTARRSNQSILKEISPKYALEGLMLKLKLQYFGQLMWRTDLLEKTLMLGNIEGRRRRGRQRMRWLEGVTSSADMSLSKLQEWWWTGKPGMLQSWGCNESDMTEQLNWSQLMYFTPKKAYSLMTYSYFIHTLNSFSYFISLYNSYCKKQMRKGRGAGKTHIEQEVVSNT